MSTRRGKKGKVFTDKVTKDKVEVVIHTVTHRIQGKVHIRPDRRLRDALNDASRFIAVTDGRILQGTESPLTFDFISVNRDHIVWVKPLIDREPREAPGSEL